MTTTTLEPGQRARLMRSTRKIGAVLGTPISIEEDSLDCLPTRSSSLSLKLAAGSTMGRPLMLCLQSIPSSDKRASVISTISAAPRSPLSPSFGNATDMRRRKMAKLAAQFGENVPPELVFRVSEKQQRRRSYTIGTSSFDEQRPDAPFSDTIPVDNEFFVVDKKGSFDDEDSVRSKSSFDSVRSNVAAQIMVRRRKERDWSGEWSQELDLVQNRLRALKSK
ncbi:hypothetical protein C8J56DRAFT_972174 [Mycena floridula]|nr:hypothetical protein C8J56DRAFT_972174 [Mycena floridula]